MRQLGFGLVDLALHREWRGEATSIACPGPLAAFSPAPCPPEHAMIAGFTHLSPARSAMARDTIPTSGPRCWTPTLSPVPEAALQRRRARVPRKDSGPRRQRGSRRTIPRLHGPRPTERAAGAGGIARLDSRCTSVRPKTPSREIGTSRKTGAPLPDENRHVQVGDSCSSRLQFGCGRGFLSVNSVSGGSLPIVPMPARQTRATWG